MIPQLIVPYISRPDLLTRLLASVEAERALVVNQSGVSVAGMTMGNGAPVREVMCDQLGYAGAVNLGIGLTPGAAWWLVASTDVEFEPSDLWMIAAYMDMGDAARVVTGDTSDDRSLRMAYFAVNPACIRTVGLLDEWSFFPAYFEDNDYQRRCRLGGVEWTVYNGAIHHDRSSTIADPTYAAKNGGTFPRNCTAYVEKWGGPPGAETLIKPWGTDDLRTLRPDPASRAARLW